MINKSCACLVINNSPYQRYRGQYFQGKHKANGMGAMAILTSLIFLVDTVFSALDAKRNSE